MLSMLTFFLGVASQAAVESADKVRWEHQAVLYAEVANAIQDTRASWTIQLKPLAVLTGNFDPALTGEINAGVWIGGLISDIRQSPKTGAKVIVVIQDAQWKGKTVYMIPNGGASFLLEIDCNDTFPPSKERPCLFEVTGFEDPKVTETIENLRKLRGKQREESEENAENKKVEEK